MKKIDAKKIDVIILEYLAQNPGCNQFRVVCALSDRIGATSVRIALTRLEMQGKIRTIPQRRELSLFVAGESS